MTRAHANVVQLISRERKGVTGKVNSLSEKHQSSPADSPPVTPVASAKGSQPASSLPHTPRSDVQSRQSRSLTPRGEGRTLSRSRSGGDGRQPPEDADSRLERLLEQVPARRQFMSFTVHTPEGTPKGSGNTTPKSGSSVHTLASGGRRRPDHNALMDTRIIQANQIARGVGPRVCT